jgi:hypothetical protein
MTTALQADVDSFPAVDVTVKVPYHLELAIAALGAGTLITFIVEVAPHVRERVTERPASACPATDLERSGSMTSTTHTSAEPRRTNK